jgi:hypothetical protein
MWFRQAENLRLRQRSKNPAQMGQDFEDVLQQIGEAQALAQRYGVTLTAYQGAPGATPAAQPAPAPAPAPAEAA